MRPLQQFVYVKVGSREVDALKEALDFFSGDAPIDVWENLLALYNRAQARHAIANAEESAATREP